MTNPKTDSFQEVESLAETTIKTARSIAVVCDQILALDLKRERNRTEAIITQIEGFERTILLREMGSLANVIIAVKDAFLGISNVATILKLTPGIDEAKLRKIINVIKYRLKSEVDKYREKDAANIAYSTVVTQKN